MYRENFYTGEPEDTGSPFSQEFISEQEAINNAGFGQYFYDPQYRGAQQQQQYQFAPYGYQQQQPMMNYNTGSDGGNENPAFAFLAQHPEMNQQVMQRTRGPEKVFIPPVNFGGSEYLPTTGFEEKIEELKMEYWKREQEMEVQNSFRNPSFGYGYNPYMGYTNYYGVPYFNQNPYVYSPLYSEINQKIEEMKQEARENRIRLNLHLSKLCHNWLKDDYNEESLRERFTGKYVDLPIGETYEDYYNQARFENLVPFDNSQMYRDLDKQVSDEFHKIISEDAGMEETFENMGIVAAQYALEEEQHRRRDGANYYNASDNSYKYFVRAKAAERYAKKHGYATNNNVNNFPVPNQQEVLNTFPTLSQSAKLSEDGTLNITCNFGSKAGQVYSVHNSQEAEYEKDRDRFKGFLNSIYQSVYNSPNASN